MRDPADLPQLPSGTFGRRPKLGRRLQLGVGYVRSGRILRSGVLCCLGQAHLCAAGEACQDGLSHGAADQVVRTGCGMVDSKPDCLVREHGTVAQSPGARDVRVVCIQLSNYA